MKENRNFLGIEDGESLDQHDGEDDRDIFVGSMPVAAIESLFTLAAAHYEAQKELLDLAEREPKIRSLLQCPQSVDKHAEGPLIRDHYQHIFTALHLIKNGSLDFARLPDAMHMGEYRLQWEAVIAFIKKNYALVKAFAICHDLGKEDFIGVYAKKDTGVDAGFLDKRGFHDSKKNLTPLDREYWKSQYLDLYTKFTERFPNATDIEVQEKFFATYGITVTYINHERGLTIRENKELADRMVAELGLTPDEEKLLYFLVAQHVSNYFDFARGPADYDAIMQISREEGLNPTMAMRGLQATMLIDGVLGARKIVAGKKERMIAMDTFLNFFAAERAHPAFEDSRREKTRQFDERVVLKNILKEVGLGGEAIVAMRIPTISRSGVIEALLAAVAGNGILVLDEGTRSILPAGVEEKLIERIKLAHTTFHKEK